MEKVRALIKQAERDLDSSCYDKSVSASYFAARMAAEIFLLNKGIKTIPRRDDKLANTVLSQGKREEAVKLLALYGLRKKADYSPYLSTEQNARLCVHISKQVVRSLIKEIFP